MNERTVNVLLNVTQQNTYSRVLLSIFVLFTNTGIVINAAAGCSDNQIILYYIDIYIKTHQ